MSSNSATTFGVAVLASLALASAAGAQTPVGVRAAGMAEAFVGVADDASGVYWNPAGLATGAYASAVLDYGRADTAPTEAAQPDGGQRQTVGLVALTTPPFGVSYYRIAQYVSGPRQAAVPGPDDREEVRRSVQSLVTSHLGLTLLQSLSQYVVVGATVKLVHGEVGGGTSASIGAAGAVEDATRLSRTGETTGDVDAGVMMALEHVRLGLVARNLTTPSFGLDGDGSAAVQLERQVRVGGAWGSGWPGNSRVVVAMDGDLTSRATPTGDRKDLAGGVETWWLGQRLGVRGGLRRSLEGESRTVAAMGVSAAVTAGVYLEGQLSRGQEDYRSWSVGARFTF